MENTIFIQIEIIILFSSLLYIIYYLWAKTFRVYFKVKTAVKPEKIWNRKTALNKVKLSKQTQKANWKNTKRLSVTQEDKEKLDEIIKRVWLNTSKWYFDLAKPLIIEWLSIDKNNRELNLELAAIYQREKNYSNAEYLLLDLLELYKNDVEILKRLWYIYALQWKLENSLKTYEKVFKKKQSDDEVIHLLAELAYSMKKWKKVIKYSTTYLIWKPRDVEKLTMKAEALYETKNLWSCISTYKRILELQPYNKKIEKVYKQIKRELDEVDDNK